MLIEHPLCAVTAQALKRNQWLSLVIVSSGTCDKIICLAKEIKYQLFFSINFSLQCQLFEMISDSPKHSLSRLKLPYITAFSELLFQILYSHQEQGLYFLYSLNLAQSFVHSRHSINVYCIPLKSACGRELQGVIICYIYYYPQCLWACSVAFFTLATE